MSFRGSFQDYALGLSSPPRHGAGREVRTGLIPVMKQRGGGDSFFGGVLSSAADPRRGSVAPSRAAHGATPPSPVGSPSYEEVVRLDRAYDVARGDWLTEEER